MSPVARMVMLDLRTVASYRNQGLAVFIVMTVLFANRPVVLVPMLVLLFTATAAAYPFNVGDKARIETLYATLPLARRAVLFGHYAWALACYLSTVSAGTALTGAARANAVRAVRRPYPRGGADAVLGDIRGQRGSPVSAVHPVRIYPDQHVEHGASVGIRRDADRPVAPEPRLNPRLDAVDVAGRRRPDRRVHGRSRSVGSAARSHSLLARSAGCGVASSGPC